MRSTPRPRREVSPALLSALSPLFRHSVARDAYVLRGIGAKRGPVLVPRGDGFSREDETEDGGSSRDPDRENVGYNTCQFTLHSPPCMARSHMPWVASMRPWKMRSASASS